MELCFVRLWWMRSFKPNVPLLLLFLGAEASLICLVLLLCLELHIKSILLLRSSADVDVCKISTVCTL